MKKTICGLVFILAFNILNTNAQELVIIHSSNLHCDDSVLVFTPDAYRETGVVDEVCCGFSDSVPTLILLHGWSGCYRDWSNKYNLQEISNKYGFRIICPDGFYNSWYLDNVDSNQMQWRKFYSEEFYPQMVEKYKLDPEKTFITGLSMGGHGAMNLFLDHPEWYAAAGSMSGVLNLLHTNLIDTQVSKVLGPFEENKQAYIDQSAVTRLDEYARKHLEGSSPYKVLVVSCGYQDTRYAASAREFCQKCLALGIPHIELYSQAPHSWKYWGFALDMHLQIFSKVLHGENLGY